VQSRVWLLVQVGIDCESLTTDEARLLLHDACDALLDQGGPSVMLWGYNLDGSETEAET
jgi:hypothetical protein